eukprot:5410674-Amphidinium_carterae.2
MTCNKKSKAIPQARRGGRLPTKADDSQQTFPHEWSADKPLWGRRTGSSIYHQTMDLNGYLIIQGRFHCVPDLTWTALTQDSKEFAKPLQSLVAQDRAVKTPPDWTHGELKHAAL